jgi:hypothetical protein
MRAVFVGLRILKMFLLSGDTNYRIRGNGKIVNADIGRPIHLIVELNRSAVAPVM